MCSKLEWVLIGPCFSPSTKFHVQRKSGQEFLRNPADKPTTNQQSGQKHDLLSRGSDIKDIPLLHTRLLYVRIIN